MAKVYASWWLNWECDECGATGDDGPVAYDETYDGEDVEHECESDE